MGAEEAGLRIQLFGTFAAFVEGEPLGPLRSVKGQHLLALLILRGGQAVGRGWLAQTLWPDSDIGNAQASLRQCLADLRRVMGAQAVRLQSPTRTELRLDLTDADIDVVAFDRAIKQSRPDALGRAIDLYRGDLLDGIDEAWAMGEREARRQAFLKALEMLAAQSRADGDQLAEIGFLRRALICDAERETSARVLMQALADAGETQGAIDVYQTLRRHLHDEHNALPDKQTQQMYADIRARAKQTAQSAHVSAAASHNVPQMDGITPAVREVRTASGVHGNVPLPLSSLIGRDDALRAVKTQVLLSRLVTLTGTGGVGKTRLATEAANDLNADFPDGAWFVDLSLFAPDTSIETLAQEIARLFALARRPEQSWRQALSEGLRERHTLLLLDNCETLLDVCATLVGELRGACPRAQFLATSRQRLGLHAEIVYPVPTLDCPDAQAGNLLPTALTASAVQMFVERARSLRPDFAPHGDGLDAVGEICCRLDGLPLALELTAPLVEFLSPRDIALRLRDSFALLDECDPARPPRHQTLRAVIRSSVSLLPDSERVLLRRLSVFVGGWTLDAAQAVCEKGKTEGATTPYAEVLSPRPPLSPSSPLPLFPLLRSLAARSLVVAEERDGQMRYRLLEPIREYAREELSEAGEETTLYARHLAYYTELACLAEAQLTGPQQSAWLEKLEAEGGNLRQALAYAQSQSGQQATGLLLASALGRYWQIRGHFAEGSAHLTRLLALPETQDAGAARANALNWTALLRVFQGDLHGARQMCEQAFGLWQHLDDERGAAGSLGILGIVAANVGDTQAARAYYGQSLERARGASDWQGVAGTLGYLGIVAANQGFYEEARGCYEESLRLRRQQQDKWGIAASLNNLGQLARKMGELDHARELLSQTLTLRRELRDRRNVGITLNVLGLIAWQQGDTDTAHACFSESLLLFVGLNDRRSVAYGLEMAARLAVSQAQWTRAARLNGAADELRTQIASPLPPLEQQELEHDLRPALDALGASAYDSTRKEGRYLTLEQSLKEALQNNTKTQTKTQDVKDRICP